MRTWKDIIPISLRVRRVLYLKKIEINRVFKMVSKHTMLSRKAFVSNLLLASRINDIEGDVVECGVWKGGMSAGMAMVLEGKRSFWLFDSFEGLPDAKGIDGETALNWQQGRDSDTYFDNCTANEKDAEEIMTMAGAENVKIVKGWFDQTLKTENIPESIALLRLDGDWYDSTMICLEFLFPRVVEGGVIIIDDYYTWDGCSRAVHDYLSKYQLSVRIKSFEGIAFIRK